METPKMMTIREVARTGILPEHAIRLLVKQGKIPAIYVGSKAIINYDAFVAQLNSMGMVAS